MAKFRILSLDGGGGLALLSARLLERIERQRPGFLSSVDLFAGTSAGGVIALLLASRKEPAQLLERCVQSTRMYEARTSVLHKLAGLAGTGPVFSSHKLQNFLRAMFGTARMSRLEKKVVVTAFELDGRLRGRRTWHPVLFDNFPEGLGSLNPRKRDELVVDIGLRTTASPVFRPIQQGYVDGGTFANNPTMCAVARAVNVQSGFTVTKNVIDTFAVFSVGTSFTRSFLSVKDGNWGWQKWMIAPDHPLALVELCLEADTMAVDFQCKSLFSNRYFRLEPELPVPASRDIPTLTEVLEMVAKRTSIAPTIKWLDQVGWLIANDGQRSDSS